LASTVVELLPIFVTFH